MPNPICPSCQSLNSSSLGVNRRRCKDCGRAYRLKSFMQELREVSSQAAPFVQKKYVITSAVNNTPVHAEFWATLQNYCAVNSARLVVVPLQYRNPTTRNETATADNDIKYAAEVVPFLYRGRTALCEKLTLCADVLTQPTAEKPLSGLQAFGGKSTRDSVIFAHPKVAMETVATQAGKLAKWATTTGACTEAWYSDTKAGAKGEFHHAFAALVVEVGENDFHIRHINANGRDGSFHDLDTFYAGEAVSPASAKVLTCGDLHAVRADASALDATFFAADSMLAVLKPAHVVLHDVLDFQCASHHNDFMTRFKLYQEGKTSVTRELLLTCELLDKIASTSPDAHFYVVDSNHDRHFERWLNGSEGGSDLQNTLAFHETRVAWMRATLSGRAFSPLQWWAQQHMRHLNRFTFLTANDSLTFDGIEYAVHGDKAANGARGAREAFTKVGTKMVIGHSHSPGVANGVYQVGTLSEMNMGYNSGYSGWLHTNCVSYVNGKRALLSIINNRWRIT